MRGDLRSRLGWIAGLRKSRHRFYRLLGVYRKATYTGQGKFEFPADVALFVRHHDVLLGLQRSTALDQVQNDVDTLVFETERQIKKNLEMTEENAHLREYEKEAAEFIEFLSTKGIDPTTATLTRGIRGPRWVFVTSNKWIARGRIGRIYCRRVDEETRSGNSPSRCHRPKAT